MKKRVFLSTLVLALLLSSLMSVSAFASPPNATGHKHHYGDPELILAPTEGKNGVLRYYCEEKDCDAYYDEAIAPLPTVYVSKFRDADEGLMSRITVAQKTNVVGDEMILTMARWNGKLMADQYGYNWEDDHIKKRSLEFKAKDVGIGTFDDKINSYTLKVPVGAITACEEDGSVVLYLTTGAAMIRLDENATAALIAQAKETIGVRVTKDGDTVKAEILVDDKVVPAPSFTEMLYWLKDAGDKETAPASVLGSPEYMNFDTEGDFDLIFVENLGA